MTATKQFKTYSQQLAILETRGMLIEDHEWAAEVLRRISYYRLSGYWFPMRRFDPNTGRSLDEFREGASFQTVMDLYCFDEKLRHIVYSKLSRIELGIRVMLGHELGRIDPLIHLDPSLLGASAQQIRRGSTGTRYEAWIRKYEAALSASREEFVVHHRQKYGGKLPIWAAVEIMDWGLLSHLYSMAPNHARNPVASACGLSAPQLESWLKTLNILRNYAAHHVRIYNRNFDVKPKVGSAECLEIMRERPSRVFTQLTLIQYLSCELGLPNDGELSEILSSYPDNPLVPFTVLGAPEGWEDTELWRLPQSGNEAPSTVRHSEAALAGTETDE